LHFAEITDQTLRSPKIYVAQKCSRDFGFYGFASEQNSFAAEQNGFA